MNKSSFGFNKFRHDKRAHFENFAVPLLYEREKKKKIMAVFGHNFALPVAIHIVLFRLNAYCNLFEYIHFNSVAACKNTYGLWCVIVRIICLNWS